MPAFTASRLISDMQKVPKEIPFCYLYDTKGSELYEEITHLEEYYPFLAEERLLQQNIGSVVDHIAPSTVVVELGCGTARKTAQVLNALMKRDGCCRFAGIDVSESFLEEARSNLMRHVAGLQESQIELVQAEYIEGLREVRRRFPDEMLCILWLGSSVGNLIEEEAVHFFKEVDVASGPKCQMLLCTDMWKDTAILYAAYHDREGVTELFIKNGVRNALSALGYTATDEDEASWEYEVDVNPKLRRVEMWVRFPRELQLIPGQVVIKENERVLMEVSRKFRVADIERLALQSRFYVHAAWRNKMYGMQMMLPAEEALRRCWNDSDDLFAKMPDWRRKPIDVRHPFCFYYGHINAFTKLKLLPGDAVSAEDDMFSRGIDPLVTDPSVCHDHPEVPPEWPADEEIKAYVRRTRAKILEVVRRKKGSMRTVCLGLEHERMHRETLQYMLAQEQRILFEDGLVQASQPSSKRPLNLKPALKGKAALDIIIPPGNVVLGVNPDDGGFVWDNEGPPMAAVVAKPFTAPERAVTVEEFHRFVVEEQGYQNPQWWDKDDLAFLRGLGQSAPATWSLKNGQYYVHSPFSTALWSDVADQPVLVSLSEASAYCTYAKGRIMTEAEYQRILDTQDGPIARSLRSGGWEWTTTVFAPFPGFQAMPEYEEYSVDFFDDKHYVLKGASAVTHPAMLRDSFRNFFQRQYPYVFAKFRVCKDVAAGK